MPKSNTLYQNIFFEKFKFFWPTGEMTPVVDGPFGGGVKTVVISGSQVHDTVKQFVPGFQVQAFEVFLVCLVGGWCRSARVP